MMRGWDAKVAGAVLRMAYRDEGKQGVTEINESFDPRGDYLEGSET